MCPVCDASGALILIVAVEDRSPRYACPLCGVAWTTPPPPHTVDEIVGIRESAPAGLRLPTDDEVRAVRESGYFLEAIDAIEAAFWWECLSPDLIA